MSSDDAQVAETNEEKAELIKPAGPKSSGGKVIRELVSEDALREDDADDAPVQKPKAKEEDAEDGLPDDPESLKREIKKLRRENAAKRTKAKEVEEAAQKWQQHVDSQKTELEKITEENSSLKQENRKLMVQLAQRDLAAEFDLDPDLAEFIVGEDLDEMREKAQKLAEKAANKKKSTVPTADTLRAGKTSPAQTKSTGAELLKQLWNGK